MAMKQTDLNSLLAFFMKGKGHTTIGASCATPAERLHAKRCKVCEYVHGGAAFPTAPIITQRIPPIALNSTWDAAAITPPSTVGTLATAPTVVAVQGPK